MDIPFQVHMYLGRLVLKFEFLHTKINEAESNYRKRSSKKGPACTMFLGGKHERKNCQSF